MIRWTSSSAISPRTTCTSSRSSPLSTRRVAATGGRLRVPIGVKDAGIGAPRFRAEASARLSALSGDNDKLVLYTTAKNGLNYVTFSNGAWSPAHVLPIDDKISSEAAIEVLRRMANAD